MDYFEVALGIIGAPNIDNLDFSKLPKPEQRAILKIVIQEDKNYTALGEPMALARIKFQKKIG